MDEREARVYWNNSFELSTKLLSREYHRKVFAEMGRRTEKPYVVLPGIQGFVLSPRLEFGLIGSDKDIFHRTGCSHPYRTARP